MPYPSIPGLHTIHGYFPLLAISTNTKEIKGWEGGDLRRERQSTSPPAHVDLYLVSSHGALKDN